MSNNIGTLGIFNTTGIADTSRIRSVVRDSLFQKEEDQEGKSRRDRPLFAITSALRRGTAESEETLIAVSSLPRKIRVAQLLLPYSLPNYDISWIRTPIMAVGALIVAYVFYRNAQKTRQQSGASLGGHNGGGLPKDFDLNDFKKFTERFERNKNGGGSGGFGDGIWRGGR